MFRPASFIVLIALIALAGCSCGDDDDDDDASDDDASDDDTADDDTSDDDTADDDTADDDTADDDTADDDTSDDDTFDDDTSDDDDTTPEPDYDTTWEGFGRNAIGGAGGDVAVVTTLADDGAGSLRDAVESASGPRVVTFAIDGTIALLHVLDIPDDITVDARGHDITLTQNGFRIDGAANIVVMNIAFVDVSGETGDGIQILNGAHDIAIVHCRFDSAGLMPFVEDIPDEQISIVWGATDITIEWCRFENHDKVLLIGNGDAPPEIDEDIRVTIHHSVFVNTGRRHPFLRYGQVDLFNNIVGDWTRYLEWPYGTRSSTDAEILAEANWYEQSNPLYFVGAYFEDGGRMKLVNNHAADPYIVLLEREPDLVFARPYPARVDAPSDAWRQMMMLHTGNTMP
ncbi:hypothetical protein K8I61_03795 [bacterium]|nr:hypothetical protein [bacterium]